MAKSNTPSAAEISAGALPVSTLPEIAPRPTVNAAAALGLPESPHESITASVTKMRKDFKLDGTASIVPEKKTEPKEEPKGAPKKAEKPSGKPEKVSSKPKLVSEKPLDPAEAEKTEDDAKPAPEASKPVEAAAPKLEDSEAYKKLVKDNEEMRRRLDEAEAARNKQAPAPAPAAPAPEAPKSQTPEELKAIEDKWVSDVSNFLEAPLSEEDHEAILDGGPKAVAKVVSMRKRDMATSILKARTSIYSELSPVIEKMMQDIQRLAPVYDDHIKLQTYRVEQSFLNKYPQMKPRMDTARAVAKALYQNHPDAMNKMSEEETFTEVYNQTSALLKSFGIDVNAESASPAPVVHAPAPAAAPAPAPVVAVTAPTPAAPAPAPVAPAAEAPKPKPPGSTAPGAQAQGGTTSKEKHREIANSLTY